MTETLPTDVQLSDANHRSHHDSLHAFFDRIIDGVDFSSDTPNVTAGYITRRLDGPKGLWMGNGATTQPMPVAVVLTADLPAASADMDGSVIVEDGGAGNRNWVLYAGGQRFRIDGGVPF